MARRAPISGGDQSYLRHVQYRDGRKLSDRARLHVKYSTAAVAWFPWLSRQVAWPVEPRVLDVGCGTGWLWVEATAALPADLDLTLTDLSEGMVRDALGRIGGSGRHRRVVGHVADIQALPFGNEQFDVVVANHMLYHVPDPRLGVRELARVVQPDGVVVAATNGSNHLRELWEIRDEVFGGDATRWFSDVFGIDNGGEMLRDQFVDVTWVPYDDRLVCLDSDDVLTFMRSCPPAETATEEQLDHLAEVVAARFTKGDGVLEVAKETGIFLCRDPRPKS
jgi:SAM-dependent methyltransferase